VTRLLRNLSVSRASPRFQALVLGTSTLLCMTVPLVYWLQPDSWAAVLLFPRWTWPVFGLTLATLAWTRKRKLASSVVAVLWLLYSIVLVEEVSSLTRWRQWPSPEWQAAHERGEAIRVVSLNCSGGDEDAAAEVTRFKPDLVLFQESPLRPKLRAMADRLVGPGAGALCGPDVSILARGEITPVPLPDLWNIPFSHARIRFASGLTAEVIVVRLQPYDIRGDLWSAECWSKHRANRLRQRFQIEWLSRYIETIPRDVPLIVGGDFNLPSGDNMLRALQPRLKDTFRESGSGWGNTMDNTYPVLRIDQVWVSAHFRAASVMARRTVHSDHRMVLSDLVYLRNH
jgi:vancomycin resistance protein VanJ